MLNKKIEFRTDSENLISDIINRSLLSKCKDHSSLNNFFDIDIYKRNLRVIIEQIEFKDVTFIEICVKDNQGKSYGIDFEIVNKKIKIIDYDSNYFSINDISVNGLKLSETFIYKKISIVNFDNVLYAKIYVDNSIYDIVHTYKECKITQTIEDFNGNKKTIEKKFKKTCIDNESFRKVLFVNLSNYLEIQDDFKEKLKSLNCIKLNLEFFQLNKIIEY